MTIQLRHPVLLAVALMPVLAAWSGIARLCTFDDGEAIVVRSGPFTVTIDTPD